MFKLARYYKSGEAGLVNTSEAVVLFQMVAALGLDAAQHQIGRLCEQGAEVPADSIAVFAWYEKDVEQEWPVAKTWYIKAADLGNEEATSKSRKLKSFKWNK
ncbi:UNVERIFIED_CONTAM: hypothetical protein HDU68_010980 [Siphonaria sp. JEL0065]|nr:hypothetical protein HDU68_010980 [Siphonaria sp. JEL0065]